MRLLLTWLHSVDDNCVDPDQLASDDLALNSFLTIIPRNSTFIRRGLDIAVPFTPFTPNRQKKNQVVLEHLCWRTPATLSSKVV